MQEPSTLWSAQSAGAACAPHEHVAGAGQTLLHIACAHRRLDAVRFLLLRGADPLARTAAGATPLHLLRLDVCRDQSERRCVANDASAWLQQPIPLALLAHEPPEFTMHPCAQPRGGGATHRCAARELGGASLRGATLRGALLVGDATGATPMPGLCQGCDHRFRRAIGHAGTPESAGSEAAAPMHAREDCGGTPGTAPGLREEDPPSAEDRISQDGVACMCFGVVWEVAKAESLRRCMLLVPEGLRAPSRPGGRLGALRCRSVARPGAEGDPVREVPEHMEASVCEEVLLSDLPLDVRVMICELCWLCPLLQVE